MCFSRQCGDDAATGNEDSLCFPTHTLAHLRPTLNKFRTDRHTYIQTYNVLRGPGWRFRRHCHASPSSTIKVNIVAILEYSPGPRSTVGVFALFPYPYRLLVCRKVKPKPTTVTHTWLAVNAQDTFCRITSTGAPKQSLLVALKLGLRTHTAGFTISQWHTYNQTRHKFGQTDRQTYIHTHSYIHTDIHTHTRVPTYRRVGNVEYR